MSVNHPLLDSGHYGHSLRVRVADNLDLFGVRTLAHSSMDLATLSFAEHIGGQFHQPSAMAGGVGNTAFAQDMITAAAVQTDHECLMTSYVYGPDGSKEVLPPLHRYSQLSRVSITAFLVCGCLAKSAGDGGQLELGERALFVLQAPAVTPKGLPAHADAVWPGLSPLAPMNLSPPSGHFHPLGALVGSKVREYGNTEKIETSRIAYLADMVYCFDGLSFTTVGWSTISDSEESGLAHLASDSPSSPFLFDTIQSIPAILQTEYFGSGSQPTSLAHSEKVIIFP
jgi:hypothetical protein